MRNCKHQHFLPIKKLKEWYITQNLRFFENVRYDFFKKWPGSDDSSFKEMSDTEPMGCDSGMIISFTTIAPNTNFKIRVL